MKRILSIILIAAMIICLFGCKRNEPDDEAVPGIEKEQIKEPVKQDAPEKEDEPAQEKEDDPIDEDKPPVTLSAQICYINKNYIILQMPKDDGSEMGIRIDMDTTNRDLEVYNTIIFKDNLKALEQTGEYIKSTNDGKNASIVVGHTLDYDDILSFGFDPENINGVANVILKCPGFLIVGYMNRPIIVKSENYDEFDERDHIRVRGKASLLEVPMEYRYGKQTQIKYEVKNAEVSLPEYIEDEAGELVGAKPVIYLYPENKTDVEVQIDVEGKLTCVYPEYDGLWQVTAQPDGTLTDSRGREYYCLYWEAEFEKEFDNPKDVGFVVAGRDTAEFLREKALALGLTEKEANEFVIYWLPQMQDNKYNYVYFAIDEYVKKAELSVSPKADTTIRFMMLFKPLDQKLAVKEQILPKTPVRNGFTVVEWGGCKIS